MPRRPSVARAERPPAAPSSGFFSSSSHDDVKGPFAAHSVGSIVRPGTSPVVGLYTGQSCAGAGRPGRGRSDGSLRGPLPPHRQVHADDDVEDDDGHAESLQAEPASTRLLRRGSSQARSRPSAPAGRALGQRPSTSGGQGTGALDCVPLQRSTSLGRVPPAPPRTETRTRELPNELPDEMVSDMVVEGQHTGEERGGVLQEKPRESLSRRASIGARGFDQGQRDRAEIRRLEREVRRLQGIVDKQSKELHELRNAEPDEQLREELQQARQRAQALERQIREGDERREWQDNRQQRQQEELEQMLRDERTRSASLRGDAEDRQVEARIKCRELEDRVESLSRERDDLRRRLTEQEDEHRRVRDQALGDKLTAEAKDRDIGDLRNQQRSREAMICQLKAALAEDASTVERLRNELRESRDEQVHKEAELIERRRKAEQFQEYVLKICQPHFAVVKDESLCPVNVSGFQVTEGHVLVPLILLLEGYALLPPQLKSVIDAKSSKLAKGIDYCGKASSDIAVPDCHKQSYKDRLYSMMDDKDKGSTQQRGRGFFSSSSALGLSEKMAQKPHSRAASSSGAWCPRAHYAANGGKDAQRPTGGKD